MLEENKHQEHEGVLGVLGEELIGPLTTKQQDFLVIRTRVHTDTRARKLAGIKSGKIIKEWMTQPEFQKAYNLITGDPIEFAQKTIRATLARATLRHLQLLEHDNVKVAMWAVRLAYEAAGILSQHIQAEITAPGQSFEIIKEAYQRGLADGKSRELPPANGSYVEGLVVSEGEPREVSRPLGLDNRPAAISDLPVWPVELSKELARGVPEEQAADSLKG